jgi:predicted GNAT family acetyltransferase
MVWQFLDDAASFAEAAWPLLSADPAGSTVPLSITAQLRQGLSWSHEPPLLAVHEGGAGVDGAVLMTPPHNLLIAAIPDGTMQPLVDELVARGTGIPGVHGPGAVAGDFADRWHAATGHEVGETVEMLLYVLGNLTAPDPAPPGDARLANGDDLEAIHSWSIDFEVEAHGARLQHDEEMERRRALARIEGGCMWLWHDADGRLVSMAGSQLPQAGVARVGPVYTPPADRRRGYGTAVTAACTQGALDAGAEHVVLFTDLANPTSNAIYQQIGYQVIGERVDLRFEP